MRVAGPHLGSVLQPHGSYPRAGLGEPTSFTLEAQLVPPVTAWLAEAGYRVDAEVSILGRRADLLGTRDDGLAAVELKLRAWEEALRQAVAYQLAADRVWVAMPLAAASSAYRQRWRFEAEGVGLLAVDDRGAVRVPIEARPSPRLLPYLRERILARPAAWAWDAPEVHPPAWPVFSPDHNDP